MEQPGGNVFSIAGQITNENGVGVANATVYIDNPTYGLLQFTTDADGHYTAPELPEGEQYSIVVSKDTSYTSGVTTADLIKIRKHILGIAYLDSPFKIISGDANLTNSVSTADIIRIQKCILGINPDFGEGGAPSWRFIPVGYQFTDPENPFSPAFPEIGTVNLTGDFNSVNFTGFKVGDANTSANPAE